MNAVVTAFPPSPGAGQAWLRGGRGATAAETPWPRIAMTWPAGRSPGRTSLTCSTGSRTGSERPSSPHRPGPAPR